MSGACQAHPNMLQKSSGSIGITIISIFRAVSRPPTNQKSSLQKWVCVRHKRRSQGTRMNENNRTLTFWPGCRHSHVNPMELSYGNYTLKYPPAVRFSQIFAVPDLDLTKPAKNSWESEPPASVLNSIDGFLATSFYWKYYKPSSKRYPTIRTSKDWPNQRKFLGILTTSPSWFIRLMLYAFHAK